MIQIYTKKHHSVFPENEVKITVEDNVDPIKKKVRKKAQFQKCSSKLSGVKVGS